METIKEFIEFYKNKRVDKYGKTNDKVQAFNPYGGQCVSLVKYFLTVFGIGYTQDSYGNAKDYINLPKATIIKNKKDLKNGDLIIWTGGTYGHIGIWYNNKVFNQNPHPASLHDLNYFDNWGLGKPLFYRPRLKDNIDSNKPVKPALGRYVTIDYLKIRTGPSTDYKTEKIKNITIDAKAKVTYTNSESLAILKKGVQVDILSVHYNDKEQRWWGRTFSGYIAMDYLKKV